MIPYLEESAGLTAERREELILDHLPQVKLIAERMHQSLPSNIALEDLISAGTVGLISAVDNYESNRGFKLKTYAEYKIRGAILDSLRGMDWASRHRRKKSKDIESAISKLEMRLHRAPTEEEIAAELNMTVTEYRERVVAVRGLNLESLDVTLGPNSTQTLLSVVPDNSESPASVVERETLEKLLADAIEKMPPPERTVLALYYHEELTLREIGQIMTLHISRVAELKANAILRLRASVASKWPTPRGRE